MKLHRLCSYARGLLFSAGKRRLWLLAALILLSPWPQTSAADPKPGIISGKVINRTTDQAVAGLVVKLETFQGHQPLDTASRTTSAGGEFQFENLDPQLPFAYVLSVTYKDISYDSGNVVFEKDKNSMNLELPVFDTGAGPDAITSKTAHTVISPEAGRLGVLEYESLFNGDKRVFAPPAEGDRGTLQFFLPKEAESVSYLAGLTPSNVVRTDKGLTYTSPVKPGQTEVAYRYLIPGQQDQYLYFRYISYPTSAYSLLVRGDAVKVDSSVLQRQPPVVINGESYQVFSAQALPPATNVMISISSAAVSQPPAAALAAPTPFSPVILGAIPAAAILGLLVFFIRKRKTAPARVAAVSDTLTAEALLEELARLDDDFEAGQIAEESYRQTRAEKKAELSRLMQPEQ